ncbi:polysaccharide lyase family 4 protein [Dothidotthia symphoricarpi CBS 119687]|uniref:rhamnogalacturonan endolyase n=1 Tax=Dothidotthia symphoricarpi CBS 119687 TaxID=1392245 RepID=A0A6A6AQ21_9PLEO|nr:polysaccharide lyase family 4 protein [Dothidotthia symphoricarpi CBS 119687]KAF2133890.1 polysaccharide lyase family 4 protein [Dothidotthia symphoricarpi CBS 119687]
MKLLVALSTLLILPVTVSAGWGWTDDGKDYVIDTNANLIVKVSKTNGDMTSIQYRGVEYNGQSGRNSHIESGLGASTVTIKQYTSPANIIKVNVKFGTLKHDLVFRYSNPNVYIFMNKVDTSVTVSRYILRIPAGVFGNNENTDTDWIPNNAPAIEAGDINAVNKKSWSKHYSGLKYGRIMDHDYVGLTNKNVGMYMIRSNHEKASGGPFFRSLVRRGGSGGVDLYDIYHYNMGHTDVMRFGLQGPSVLHFTDGGAAPNANLFARRADWSWMDTLGIEGWVPTSKRGAVVGVGINNMKDGYQYVVGLKNAQGQYWATATGAWRIENVLPGTYTLNVYKGELEVHTSTVTITAGGTVTKNTITCADPADTTAIWRIGEWDGTPKGFLNFQDSPMKPTYMHPSDSRLASWDAGNYIVGTSNAGNFPGYIWKEINDEHLVYFRLTDAQLAQSLKVRVGVTEGLAGGRPNIAVNTWTATLQSDKGQGDTRSLTVGTYRGNNHIYEFTVPASAWIKSSREYQILKISIVSGKTGAGFLSPGISVDAIDMIIA